jgi:hypothetical protein
VREIRTLRAMWRALETGLRQLLNGHEEGNLGYKPRRSLRDAAPVLDPTNRERSESDRSTTTKDNVRKQCAKALKTDACDMNAQDCMLQNVSVTRFRIVRTFCGAHHFVEGEALRFSRLEPPGINLWIPAFLVSQ